MKKLILFLFILSCFNAIGQHPNNYQPRPVREWSIAQMFDSTATLPRYSSVPSGLRGGSSTNSGHVAIDTINHVGFFYSGDKWRAFGSQGFETRLVNGGKVTWDSLLVFSVAPAIYYINGAYYTSTQTYLTLDAANGALDRIDLIYLDSTGAHKETGVAAATPEEPSLPANSIRLTAILIPATATVPGGGVDTVTIYDENVEWTVSTTSLTAPSTDNTSPFHFITDIQTGAITNASILKFTATSAIDVSSFTALRFYIKLKGTFSPSTYLTVYFVRSGVKICIPIEIKNGTYGFTRTNTTSYQQITIPISDFGFTSTAADGLWFQPSGSNSSGFYMDWVQLQGGISQPVPSNTYTANLPIRITNNVISADTSRALAPSLATNWYLKFKTDSLAALKLNITDTSNKWITSVYRRTDSVFYVKGGTEYFAYKDSTGNNLLRFGKAGEDATAAESRNFELNGNNFNIIAGGTNRIKIDMTNGVYQLGDDNNSYIIVDSTNKSAAIQASADDFVTYDGANDLYWTVINGFLYTSIDAANKLYRFGDISSGSPGNNTYLQVDDANSKISIKSGTGDRITSLAGETNLTESSATAFIRIDIPTGETAGGEIIVSVHADDATDFQNRTLRFIWSAVNKAGTITVNISTPEEQVAVSAGTLTATITAVDSGSGHLDFKANAVSSLSQTTLKANAQVIKNFGTGTVTSQ